MSFDFIDRKHSIRPFAPGVLVETAPPECALCANTGWECYGLGHGDPHFRVCEMCGNPEDLPSP
jgi:hypothetical protein